MSRRHVLLKTKASQAQTCWVNMKPAIMSPSEFIIAAGLGMMSVSFQLAFLILALLSILKFNVCVNKQG